MAQFLREGRPTLVGMLRSGNVEELLKEIALFLEEGIDAFGFQIEILIPEERTEENFRRLFGAMHGKPVYVTNYARMNAVPHTDEELMEELLMAAKCGANLIDVRGDLYDRQPEEFTKNEEAVKKQKEIIARLKALGTEVLMSSHVLRYIPAEKVMEIAMAQQERGADVAKIVTEANSEKELLDNLKTTIILKETLSIPGLFLCNGTHCRMHRMIGPLMAQGMFLVVENSYTGQNQPTAAEAKRILRLAGYADLP